MDAHAETKKLVQRMLNSSEPAMFLVEVRSNPITQVFEIVVNKKECCRTPQEVKHFCQSGQSNWRVPAIQEACQ